MATEKNPIETKANQSLTVPIYGTKQTCDNINSLTNFSIWRISSKRIKEEEDEERSKSFSQNVWSIIYHHQTIAGNWMASSLNIWSHFPSTANKQQTKHLRISKEQKRRQNKENEKRYLILMRWRTCTMYVYILAVRTR